MGFLHKTYQFTQHISWKSTETSEWPWSSLSFCWKTQQQPLRVHWALIVWSTVLSERPTEISERPAETHGDHWMTERVHQNRWVCWQIAERLLKDCWALVERSLIVHWKPAPLKNHWETCFEPVQNLMETMPTTELSERSLRSHGRPWRSLRAHWKTVERSVKFCGPSTVSPLWKAGIRSSPSKLSCLEFILWLFVISLSWLKTLSTAAFQNGNDSNTPTKLFRVWYILFPLTSLSLNTVFQYSSTDMVSFIVGRIECILHSLSTSCNGATFSR